VCAPVKNDCLANTLIKDSYSYRHILRHVKKSKVYFIYYSTKFYLIYLDRTACTEPQWLTRLHFTFTYTSTPPMDRTACTEPQWLTRLHFTFTYTSTPPMGRTACTEPKCLTRLHFTFIFSFLFIR